MKRNNTKKALVLSAISILVCLTMLIGSTFAWFTDTASTGVSKIESGTLDIDLLHQNDQQEWVTAVGGTLNFVQHECTNGKMLWEPGCTYDLEPVKVVNKGNLALKYKIELTGIDGEAKLLEVIDWTVKMNNTEIDLVTFEGVLYPADTNPMPEGGSSESSEITISGHMREEAGNEYQNKKIEGIGITVYATQYTWECDSYGNQYDKDATLDFIPVADEEALIAALNTGKTVSLTTAITPSSALNITNAVINGNGNELSGGQLGTNARVVNLTTGNNGAASLTLNGVKMVGETAQYNSKGISAYEADSINLNVTNSSIEAKAYAIRIGTGVTNGATLNVEDTELIGWAGLDTHAKTTATFKNTTFTCSNGALSGSSNGYHSVEFQDGSQGSTVVFENCTFNLTKSGDADYGFFGANFASGEGNISITCRNCTFIYNGVEISYEDVPTYTYNMTGTNSLVIE